MCECNQKMCKDCFDQFVDQSLNDFHLFSEMLQGIKNDIVRRLTNQTDR